MSFFTSNFDEIRSGKITDVYFERAKRVLEAKNIRKRARLEVMAKSLPSDWSVFVGLAEILSLLEDLPVNVRSVPEGTVFRPFQPVMEIEGVYNDFGSLETAILGLMCQSSGIATKAARCRIAAANLQLVSFGARRMHPSIAPMIDRAAYIGGCDGVALTSGAEMLGLPAIGTMPHSLILMMGGLVPALKAFDETIEDGVRRVALVDTFGDEKFEALNAAKAITVRLYAVRLDTPGSRRGDFEQILREVRWELDRAGYRHVKLFVSGGLDEDKIIALGDSVDGGFGVGTAISAAATIDYSMDIVEIEGEAIAKRGKASGAKHFLRCRDCGWESVIPIDRPYGDCEECGGVMEQMLALVMEEGKILAPLTEPEKIRDLVLRQLPSLRLSGPE
ncbi:MAG: nicotinate phosphoribosyltransferase [Nitrospinota bacterium]|nr:nicotinate phosphoribosyltransferase [Nitrospinota bacterium]MDP7370212.1 nicotinate phosphoribosyltransferase [Nitrospinota bacterium]MDP7503024.1 nicotinate phosphoribosyltransferase [Nitrospinota bacterium]MDP7663729.1 nicotinate phosphoribosyltransferase [Nitrospinota bacterium]